MDDKEKLEKLLKLEAELDRLNSYTEVQRLIGDFVIHNSKRNDDSLSKKNLWKFFADREDSTAEIDNHGVYVGFGHIKQMYEDFYASEKTSGTITQMDLNMPMIVIAEDGKTARGAWEFSGFESDYYNGSELEAMWYWGRVAADFIRENGVWKIWHYHQYLLFRCPYNVAWGDYEAPDYIACARDKRPGYTGIKRDRDTTYYEPFCNEKELEPVPDCPEFYDTYTAEMPEI